MSETTLSETRTSYIAALDGLRTLAIVLVVFRHGIYYYYQAAGAPDGIAHPLWRFLVNGWVGVDLFYVLSGFLIARSLLAGHRQGIKLYLAKRALRIIPAYYTVLILCIAGAFPFYQIAQDHMVWRFVYHALFLQDYLPSNINVVFWSLGVEEKFYLFVPLVILLILKWTAENKHMRAFCLLGGLFCAGIAARTLSFYWAGAPSDYVEFFYAARSPFHACLEPLLMGVVIAYAQFMGWGNLLSVRKTAPFVFASGAVCITGILATSELMKHIGWYDAALQPALVALCMGALIYGGVFGGAPKICSHPVFRLPARLSYSWYLVHVPLWPFSFVFFKTMINQDAGLAHLSLFLCVFFILTGLAAAALYVIIERPFLDIKDRLSREE